MRNRVLLARASVLALSSPLQAQLVVRSPTTTFSGLKSNIVESVTFEPTAPGAKLGAGSIGVYLGSVDLVNGTASLRTGWGESGVGTSGLSLWLKGVSDGSYLVKLVITANGPLRVVLDQINCDVPAAGQASCEFFPLSVSGGQVTWFFKLNAPNQSQSSLTLGSITVARLLR